MRLSLRDARFEPLRIPIYNAREAALALARCRSPGPLAALAYPSLDGPLLDALGRWRATGDPYALDSLVGWGPGSTPTGDDLLLGVLVAARAMSGVSPIARCDARRARQLLRGTRLSERTPTPSAQALAAALEGAAHEAAIRLAVALGRAGAQRDVDRAASRLATLGASSGACQLFGISTALRRFAAAGRPLRDGTRISWYSLSQIG
ncbi:MAG: DUF2877 domain-containing protein [Candidatus Bipolaricaulota bacterium]